MGIIHDEKQSCFFKGDKAMCADKSKGIRKTLEVPEEEQDDIEDESNGKCTCTCNYHRCVVDKPLALYSVVPRSIQGSFSLLDETKPRPRAAVGGRLNTISHVHCADIDSNALAIIVERRLIG